MKKIKVCRKNLARLQTFFMNLTGHKLFNSEFSLNEKEKIDFRNLESFTNPLCADDFTFEYDEAEKKFILGELNGFGYSIPFNLYIHTDNEWVFIENAARKTILVLKRSDMLKQTEAA
jgi:hypothetical protein